MPNRILRDRPISFPKVEREWPPYYEECEPVDSDAIRDTLEAIDEFFNRLDRKTQGESHED